MYRKQFIDLYLNHGFDFEEAKSEVDFALDVLFNYNYQDFITGKTLEDWQINKLLKMVEERVTTHRPMQQIVGQAYFYGRCFFVDKNTLIPRPETELLVKEVLELAKNIEAPEILDIGTGTGCIPITIALENQNAKVDAIDISKEALEVAGKNKLYHNVFSNVNFFQSNLFENVTKKYDIIVSNPPYIPLKEINSLETEVKDFDPHLALFASDEHGIYFYEKIIEKAADYLKDNGFILFETGINQCILVKDILKSANFKNIRIIEDLNKIERIITAQK